MSEADEQNEWAGLPRHLYALSVMRHDDSTLLFFLAPCVEKVSMYLSSRSIRAMTSLMFRCKLGVEER
ncbi:hypothetical protein BX666DRAFT_1927540 [Dichotomocladium elegans]|nr:hypothetical protein BX666DRAFT_1927540 [Dichotomocladium elegans]